MSGFLTRLRLAGMLLVILVATNCSMFQRKEPQPEIALAGSLLVFPFGDGLQSPLDSPRGATLAGMLTTLLGRAPQNARIQVISWERLAEAAASGGEIETKVAEDIAKGVGARYLLTGRIVRMRTRRPGSVNVLQGEGTVEYQVQDLVAGTLVYSGQEETIYPEDYLGSWGVSGLDEDDADVEDGLYLALARKIASHFLPPDHEDGKNK